MAYSDFTFAKLEDELGLTIAELNLFSEIAPVEPSLVLKEVLKENVPLGLSINTEKARSELIISPVLVELRKQLNHQISLFSGLEFNVAPTKGLKGFCDFVISGSPTQIVFSAPLIQIVEAKNENIKSGIPQCVAEMCAAQIFNKRKGTVIPILYGVVTIGSSWKFLQLQNKIVTIDSIEYFIDNPGKLLGIMAHMIDQASQ